MFMIVTAMLMMILTAGMVMMISDRIKPNEGTASWGSLASQPDAQCMLLWQQVEFLSRGQSEVETMGL